jgi:hypothetical protein
MARNNSPVGTIWSAKNSSITISPLAALLKASTKGWVTYWPSVAPA